MGWRVQDALWAAYAQIDRAMVQYTSDKIVPLSRARGKKPSPDDIDSLSDMSLESVTFNIWFHKPFDAMDFLDMFRWYFDRLT